MSSLMGRLGLLLVVLVVASPGFAQPEEDLVKYHGVWATPAEAAALAARSEAALGTEPREFGTEDVTILNVGACDFHPRDTSDVTNGTQTNCVSAASKNDGTFAAYGAEIDLPNGALITQIVVFYSDTDPTSNPSMGFFRVSTTGVLTTIQGLSPGAFSGGNNTATFTLATPHQVDNTTNHYVLLAILSRTNAAQEEKLYRVAFKYLRQVSPAPAVATFSDVSPGHPFFQYIEAMVAAGITSGCAVSPLQYCPDRNITRGEMAVFFSKALGLHFPN